MDKSGAGHRGRIYIFLNLLNNLPDKHETYILQLLNN